jgi:hypothetical protein
MTETKYMAQAKEHTLNALCECVKSRDRTAARAFLTELMDQTPRENWRYVVPMACYLLRLKGWRKKVHVDIIRDYCTKRIDIMKHMDEMPVVDGIDGSAELMVSIAIGLAEVLWGASVDIVDMYLAEATKV